MISRKEKTGFLVLFECRLKCSRNQVNTRGTQTNWSLNSLAQFRFIPNSVLKFVPLVSNKSANEYPYRFVGSLFVVSGDHCLDQWCWRCIRDGLYGQVPQSSQMQEVWPHLFGRQLRSTVQKEVLQSIINTFDYNAL